MRTVTMVVLALALVTPVAAPAQQQQQDKQQAATRQQLQQKMRELEQQMRELQREMGRMEPEARTRVRARTPMVQVFDSRAYLGVRVDIRQAVATDSIGAVLAGVTPGGPADEAGLKGGDIVTTFNGEKLAGRYPAAGDEESEPGRKLVDFAHELESGDTVKVDYRRGKETRKATIVARELDADSWAFSYSPMPKIQVETGPIAEAFRAGFAPILAGDWLDVELVALNPELGEYFGTSEGLLVIRAPEDSSLNLKGGDVILAIDGRKPTSQSQMARIFRSYGSGDEMRIDIMRQKRKMTVTAKVPERRSRRDGLNWRWDWER